MRYHIQNFKISKKEMDEDLICSNVTVAVRIRPSNEKEKKDGNVVDTCGEKTLSVSHPSEHGSKRFTVRSLSLSLSSQ